MLDITSKTYWPCVPCHAPRSFKTACEGRRRIRDHICIYGCLCKCSRRHAGHHVTLCGPCAGPGAPPCADSVLRPVRWPCAVTLCGIGCLKSQPCATTLCGTLCGTLCSRTRSHFFYINLFWTGCPRTRSAQGRLFMRTATYILHLQPTIYIYIYIYIYLLVWASASNARKSAKPERAQKSPENPREAWTPVREHWYRCIYIYIYTHIHVSLSLSLSVYIYIYIFSCILMILVESARKCWSPFWARKSPPKNTQKVKHKNVQKSFGSLWDHLGAPGSPPGARTRSKINILKIAKHQKFKMC